MLRHNVNRIVYKHFIIFTFKMFIETNFTS